MSVRKLLKVCQYNTSMDLNCFDTFPRSGDMIGDEGIVH